MFPILIRSFCKEFRIQHGRGLSLILVFVILPFWFERVFFFWSTRHLVSDFGHLELIILLWSWPVFNCFGFGSFQYLYPFLGLISTQLFEFLLRVSVIVFRFVLFSSSQWSIALGFVLVPFWLLIYCIILLGSCSGVFGLLYCFGFV